MTRPEPTSGSPGRESNLKADNMAMIEKTKFKKRQFLQTAGAGAAEIRNRLRDRLFVWYNPEKNPYRPKKM